MARYQNAKLEIRKDVGRPYYFVRITVKRFTDAGEKTCRERKVLGFLDEISKKEAMNRRAGVLGAANSGRVLIQSQITMGTLLDRYLEAWLPQLGAATQATNKSKIETHIRPAFASKKLCEIDAPMIQAWLMSKEKLSWWSKNGLRGVLSSVFAAAKTWKMWNEDNPTEGVNIGRKKEKREKRLVTAEQVRQILAGVCDRTRLMILTALLLGLRVSEICGLRWNDFDFQAGTVKIQRRWYRGNLDDTKSEAGQRLLELGPLAAEFSMIRKPGGYVFSDDGITPVDERDVLAYEVRPLLRKLGLYYPGFGWHSYRRGNVTLRQTLGGATPIEAMKAAGHSRLDMTALYTLGDATRERSQVQAIFDNIIGSVEGPKQ